MVLTKRRHKLHFPLDCPPDGRLPDSRTDKTGVGRIVPVGLVIVGLSFLGLTQLEADTSDSVLVAH
jgi:hypothetical protein